MLVVMENNNDYIGYNFGDGYNDGLYCLLISFDGFKCGYISVNFEMFNNVLRLNDFEYDEIDEGLSDRDVLVGYIDNLSEGGEEYMVIKVDEYLYSEEFDFSEDIK